MYFKTYAPATKPENLATARAFHTYNAVRNFCGKDEPRFPDFVAYCAARSLTFRERILFGVDPDAETLWAESLRSEWTAIREAVQAAGQPLRKQFVVYFAIIENGVKCGETNDLVQRYCNINRSTPIQRMWYMEVSSKEEAQLAERALHNIFDHARCMSRRQNKKDYYDCDMESAQRFLSANKKKIYEAIMAMVKGE